MRLSKFKLFSAMAILAAGAVIAAPLSASADTPLITISGTVQAPGMTADGTISFYATVGTASNAGYQSNGRYSFQATGNSSDGSFSFQVPENQAGNSTVQITSASETVGNVRRSFPTIFAGDGASAETANTFKIGTSNVSVGTIHLSSSTITGHLATADGSPLAYGWAAVYTPGDGDNYGTFVTAQQTDADGDFTLPGVPIGEYKVGYTDTDGFGVEYGQLAPADSGYQTQWSNAKNDFADADSIYVDTDRQVVGGLTAYLQKTPIVPTAVPNDYASYVALGDSYQSGEGDLDYYPGTDVKAQNVCHRSDNAYPALLTKDGYADVAGFSFWACSGATTQSMAATAVSTSGPPWDDPAWTKMSDGGPSTDGGATSQLGRLSTATQLVTVGIGGNDMQFGPILKSCFQSEVLGVFDPFPYPSCEAKSGAEVDARLADFVKNGLWTKEFQSIKDKAPNARILVLGYPHFFKEDPTAKDATCPLSPVRRSDELWINQEISKIDVAIGNAAQAEGLEYVDTFSDSTGHEECSSSVPFLTGIVLAYLNSSFHPLPYGHRIIANQIEAKLSEPAPHSTVTLINQAQTITLHRRVPQGTPVAHFSTGWPGSDVQMTLTSPSGRTISASTTDSDVTHSHTATNEEYDITSPEAGLWTISLYGAQIADGGENVKFVNFNETTPNIDPTAIAAASQSEDTVQFSSAGTVDPDGKIENYVWDFGDGTISNLANPTHTYTKPGTYQPTLVAVDNQGGDGFAQTQSIVIGDKLVYSSTAPGNPTASLYTMHSDGSHVTPVEGSFPSNLTQPVWSPDGSKIAFASIGTDGSRIYVSSYDGSNATAITDGTAIDTEPAWSPDGTKIAFTSTLRSGLSHIYVMNADGSGVKALTSGTGTETSAAWSPDGTKIAFAAGTTVGQQHIVVANADGSSPTTITTGSTVDGQPTWSPDGTRLMFTSGTTLGTTHLFVVNADGTSRTQLTSSSNSDTDPAWSPDGTKVTFTRNVSGNADIYSMHVDGTQLAQLTTQAGFDGQAKWR